jgi:hypothetical protein
VTAAAGMGLTKSGTRECQPPLTSCECIERNIGPQAFPASGSNLLPQTLTAADCRRQARCARRGVRTSAPASPSASRNWVRQTRLALLSNKHWIRWSMQTVAAAPSARRWERRGDDRGNLRIVAGNSGLDERRYSGLTGSSLLPLLLPTSPSRKSQDRVLLSFLRSTDRKFDSSETTREDR